MGDEVLAAALDYADNGWRVFPLHSIRENGDCTCGRPTCQNKGKHPKTRNGVLDATTDEGQVARWFSTSEPVNIGIATGPGSGLLVLDVDYKRSIDLPDGRLVPEGEHSLSVLEDEYGFLPNTREVETGSGGRHYVFALEPDSGGEDIGNRQGFRPSLDIRADGGYVVAPPSIHASGRRYRWVDDSEPVAPAPRWLLEDVSSRRGTTALEPGEVVGEGERNGYLHRVGSRLRGVYGLGGLELFGALQAHNLNECSPPLSADEVRQIAESCERYSPNETGPAITLTAGSVGVDGSVGAVPVGSPGDELGGVRPDAGDIGEGEDLAVPIDVFISEAPEPPVALVDKLIFTGTGIILGGQPNVGKSWLAFDLALAVASGGRWLGAECKRGNVLIIDEEGTNYGDWSRLNMLLDGRQLSTVDLPVYLSVGKDLYLDSQKGESVVRRMVDRYRPDLVIFDSLTRMHSGDENNAQAMAGFFRRCKLMMRAYGCAMAFTHHVRKPSIENLDPGDLLRGSTEIRAWPDTIFMAMPGDTQDEVILHHVKSRDSRRYQPQRVGLRIDEVTSIATIVGLGEVVPSDSITTNNALIALISRLGPDANLEMLAYHAECSTRTMSEKLKVLEKIRMIEKEGEVYVVPDRS